MNKNRNTLQECQEWMIRLGCYNKIQIDILNESNLLKEWGEPNTTGWLNVGIVKNASPLAAGGDLYLMVNQNAEQVDDFAQFKRRNAMYNTKEDGSGKAFFIDSIPNIKNDMLEIYPEYRDEYYGWLFLGKPKGEQGEIDHANFIGQMNTIGNDVVLQHDSSYKITNGVIQRGKTNPWSNSTDKGVYFWATAPGKDKSNGQQYSYFCKVPMEEIYDMQTNIERYRSNDQARANHKYIALHFDGQPAIVVNTLANDTPIWYIRDNRTGKYYDAKWNEIVKQ